MRRRRHGLNGLDLLAVALLGAMLALGFQTQGDRALYSPARQAEDVTVYVIDNGFHSDLVLPVDPLRAWGGATAQALTRLPPVPYVTLGWGDAEFFADRSPAEARLADGMRALLGPNNPSVVRLEPLSRPPEQAYLETVLRFRLTAAGFERLARRLDASFTTPLAVAPPAPVGPGDPRYFASTERFNIAHLCNHWTAQLLAEAGVPTRPVLDTLSAGLDFDLTHGGGAERLR